MCTQASDIYYEADCSIHQTMGHVEGELEFHPPEHSDAFLTLQTLCCSDTYHKAEYGINRGSRLPLPRSFECFANVLDTICMSGSDTHHKADCGINQKMRHDLEEPQEKKACKDNA
jgi:hypothetical protein